MKAGPIQHSRTTPSPRPPCAISRHFISDSQVRNWRLRTCSPGNSPLRPDVPTVRALKGAIAPRTLRSSGFSPTRQSRRLFAVYQRGRVEFRVELLRDKLS
jgi:hypothetical protein